MALCIFADRFSMFDVTPVENLFIEEFMPHANGDYVKVYLYGLHLCYHPIGDAGLPAMAAALSMEEKTVEDAFTYWERRGLVRKITDQPKAYAFINLKELMVSGNGGEDEVSESNRAFNRSLQDLFGTRLLHAPEYEKMYLLMEDFGFSADALLMLVKHCIETSGKGTSVTFAAIEKQGKLWAKKGAVTLQAAEDYVRTLSQDYEGAKNVLNFLGQKRSPTVPEEQMYAKWRSEWGFSHEAILYACGETTKIKEPNLSYVDKVLENRRNRQQMTSMEMEAGERMREEAFRPVREVLEKLGQKNVSVTEDDAALYSGWRSAGFSHEVILATARHIHRFGKDSLGELSMKLKDFAVQQLYSGEQLKDYVKKEELVYEVLRASASRQTPTREDVAMVTAWQTRGYSKALILEAAQRGKGKPMSYIHTILENWAAKGISTVEAARREKEEFDAKKQTETGSGAVTRPTKEVSGQKFTQREYTDEQMEEMFAVDIDTLNDPEGK